ncbi:SprT-like domain-containing protein [Rubrivivax gelatinosus]|uniref:SprT-like domain-containing protein n=1 Tax=Rubrivivax gelatinosus TaxID=28068 RepID=UPI0005C20BF3|nr:SprT-like domain-containing protein [Rubrivivax gelatinosus]MBG6083029.1 putative SprT family Zn-dependent metalloprotease [Rubrivivax gelatinosus]
MNAPTDTTHIRPTQETYDALQLAYDFFNERLFASELPGALITLQRVGRSMGHFSPERFVNRVKSKADEIALNPVYFATRPVEDTLSTLAHEMAHQWRDHSGAPGRRCYHDRQWANKMIEIGLQPSSTGCPGGKEVGEKMSHYIVPEGHFIRICKELLATSFGIRWFDRYPAEAGKDYEYAQGVTIQLPRAVAAQSQANASGSACGLANAVYAQQSEFDAVEGLTDAPAIVAVPVFSPPPVETGLEVALVEERSATASRPRKTDASNRVKYTCPGCKTNLWAKPAINVNCGDCRKRYQPSTS